MKEMRLANTVRMATQASNDQYRQFFNNLQSELLRLDGKLKDLHKESWADLRAKGRG